MTDMTAFSRFFHEATPAERRDVFEHVIGEMHRAQMEKSYEFARLMAGRGIDTVGG
jgi:hypothetical protein